MTGRSLTRPKLLLIQPRTDESFWSFPWMTEPGVKHKQCISPPLGVATVAALTPADWDITIVDENWQQVPWETDADIVAVGGTNLHYHRQIRWLQHFRSQGKHVVAGGPYVSLVPEHYSKLADTLIVGEVERTWPMFCADWPHAENIYREAGEVDLGLSPAPRYDLLDMSRYIYGSIQFSRGCPYRCEFCDVIVIYGRRPRVKGLDQIEAELDALVASGVRGVFFVDDNLIGNRPAARELMEFLIAYQKRLASPLTFGCQMTMNIAQDPDLLTLMRRARFEWAFLGIESADLETLRGIKKGQNAKMDPLEAVRTIYAHGIQIYSGFIVGFDEDTVETFERQRCFIQASGIQVAMISPLFAAPKTPLYDRVKAEGRLIDTGDVDGMENTTTTNMIPKRMRLRDLLEGHAALYRSLYSYSSISSRIVYKMRYLRDPVVFNQLGGHFGIAKRLRRAMEPARPWIESSLHCVPEELRPVAMKDWSLALMVRDYVQRKFCDGRHPVRAQDLRR